MEDLAGTVSLPQDFAANGYNTIAAGEIYHEIKVPVFLPGERCPGYSIRI